MTQYNHNVPSRRYLQFITAFEKAVENAQRHIKRIETMECPYNLVQSALEEANIPNDIVLTLTSTGIEVIVYALPNNSIEIFENLSARIGEKLKNSRLHESGIPSCIKGGSSCQIRYIWHGKNINNSTITYGVSLNIIIPNGGLIDLKVETVDYTQTYSLRDYVFTKTNKKT
jgi:hypothetical protein